MRSSFTSLRARPFAAAVLSFLLAGLTARAEVVTAIDEDFDDGQIQGQLVGAAAIRRNEAGNPVLALPGAKPGRLGGVWFDRELDFQAGKTTVSFDLRVEEERTPLAGLSVILQVNGDRSAIGQAGGQLGMCFDPALRYVAAAIDLFDDGKFDPDPPRGGRPDHVEIHLGTCPLAAEPAGSSAGTELPDFRALGARGIPVRVTVEIDEGRVHVLLQTAGDARFARPLRVATALLSGVPNGATAILGLAAERSDADGVFEIDDLEVTLDLPPARREAGKVWLESDRDGSSVLVLESKEPLYGGQVLVGYDPRRARLARVARGPDFPAGDGSASFDLATARGCGAAGLEAAAVRWSTGSRAAGPLAPGRHRLVELFFTAAGPGECSRVLPLPCAEAQSGNTGVGQDEDLPLAIEDRSGEVCPSVAFQRGDANADGAQNITDAIFTLVHLYAGGAAPPCLDAADANDDGAVNITDPIFHLLNLFGGGAPPPAPYPGCGLDPTPDALDCASYPGCGGPVEAFPENEHYGIFNRFSIRREAHLGCDRWHPGQFPEDCTSPGAFERDPYTSTAGGTAVEIPWLATRFLAAAPDSTATITLSPLEAMNESMNHLHARSPLFVRALVDGEAAEPGEVRITTGAITDTSAFTFVRKGLAPGLHVVTVDWRVEADPSSTDDPIALLRGASVLVRTGIDSEAVEGDPEDAADLLPAAAHAPAEPHEIISGAIYDPDAWENIKGEGGKELFLRFFVPNEKCVVALTFSAEVKAEYWTALDVRALVDESPDAFEFPVVWLAQALSGKLEPPVVLSPVSGFATRSWTFLTEQGSLLHQLPPGWHRARFQMRSRGSAYYSAFPSIPDDYPVEPYLSMDRRSAYVAVAPKQTGFTRMLFAQAGPDEEAEAAVNSWGAVPGLGLTIDVPENAHVAITFQGEMRLELSGQLRLTLDGTPVPDTESEIFNHLGAFSHTFALKHLPAGSYDLGMEWLTSGNGAQWTMGTRNLLAVIEELPVPDLGTGPDVGSGSGQDAETLLADPVEPHHRVQRILPILIDPRRPQVAKVRVAGTSPGDYVVTLNGADHTFTAGDGATVEEIRDGLVALLGDAGEPVAVDVLANDLFRVRAFDGDLGEDVFTISVSAPQDGLVLSVAQAPLPVPAILDQIVFGASESVADYWRVSSGDRLRLEPALLAGEPPLGILGPFEPLLTGSAALDTYWGAKDCTNAEEIYAGGHAQRYHEGLLAADEAIDFSQFDDDRDGHLEHDEVIVLLITPQTGNTGSNTGTALEWSPFCSGEPLELDGVFIPQPTEWYTGNGEHVRDMATLAHELGHGALGLDDMYIDGLNPPHEAGRKSIMADQPDGVWQHLDGVQKLALGWVAPRVVRESGEYELEDVKTGREVLILPRAGSLGREYFLIEHRLERDLGEGLYDHGIGSSGLLVWHVLEPTATGCDPLLGDPSTCLPLSYSQCFDGYNFGDVAENYIRRALRLVRPGLAFSGNGSGDAWNGDTPDLLDDEPVCPDEDTPGAGKLRWGDSTPSGYQVLGICGDSDPDDGVDCDAPAGPVMRFTISVEE